MLLTGPYIDFIARIRASYEKGLPGKAMLKGYLDGLRARGVKLARDWDQ